MKTFSTFENVPNMRGCRKRPITVHAKQINEPFVVCTLEGNHTGKPGDFLMQGVDRELYVCAQDKFLKTYDWV